MFYDEIREQLPEDVAGIIDHEWAMFDRVNNIGGRADCQDNRPTFYIMRGSQLCAWSKEMRESYLDDLMEAEKAGRNLLTEKYGYMMERTNREEYKAIEKKLPARSPEKMELIGRLCATAVTWQEALTEAFPAITGQGRATHSEDDRSWATSFETYMMGELSTYSMRTLRLYEEHLESLKDAGINMNRAILAKEAQLYGYPSLEEAELAVSCKTIPR